MQELHIPCKYQSIFGAVAGESNGIFKSEKLNDISSLLQVQVEDTEYLAQQKHSSVPGPLLSKAETRISPKCRVSTAKSRNPRHKGVQY